MSGSKLTFVACIALTLACVGIGANVVVGQVHKSGVAKNDEPKDESPRAFLGIRYEGGGDEDAPVKVVGLFDDGPAAKAGIKEGDTIVKVADKETKNLEALGKVMRTLKPGQTVTVKVKRDDKEMDIKVTLGKRPSEEP